nr:LacI family DNA-binding transcriptional regulator [Lysinibacillus timonensis]
MRPTIYDVAQVAGVSIATVSKVVNKTGNISEKTRRHVKNVIKQLDYEPSSIASALSKKKTKTVGIIVPNIANPFYGEVTRLLEQIANRHDYSIILSSTYNQPEREKQYIRFLLQKEVDAIIIGTELLSDQEVMKLNKRNIPIAKLSVPIEEKKVISVTTDNFAGGYLAARHLYDNGHRSIKIIGDLTRQSECDRIEGFIAFYKEKGITISDEQIISREPLFEEEIPFIDLVLRSSEKVTAIFSTTDFQAVITMNALYELGYSIPEDYSVIGFDNTMYAKLSQPTLTTIEQPIREMTEMLFQQLLCAIETEQMTYKVNVFQPRLIERQSVRNIKKG